LDLKKAYYLVLIYNVLMKIHHFCIRGKFYNFIENLYLFFKVCVRVDGQLLESFSIKKGVRQGRPHLPILFVCSLMTFLINMINIESLLVIN